MRKRAALFLAWFGGLFAYNVVVHHTPATTRPVLDAIAVGVSYLTAPVELLLSAVVVILIVTRNPKKPNTPDAAKPKKPTPL